MDLTKFLIKPFSPKKSSGVLQSLINSLTSSLFTLDTVSTPNNESILPNYACLHKSFYTTLEYDTKYLYAKNTIPLGPELPLLKKKYTSSTLFETFLDRIPSRDNPACPDYCKSTGISASETNPLILLATIGRKGPSSFIFEPVYKHTFSSKDIKKYRQELRLTLREFAIAFDLAYSNLNKIETGKLEGLEVLKKIELYIKFPKVALYVFLKNSNKLHDRKQQQVIHYLMNAIDQD